MKFDQYLSGMVELRVPPERTEELLQQITAAGIHLHHIQRQEDGLYLWILLDDFAILQRMLPGTALFFSCAAATGPAFFGKSDKTAKGTVDGCFSLLCAAVSVVFFYLGV